MTSIESIVVPVRLFSIFNISLRALDVLFIALSNAILRDSIRQSYWNACIRVSSVGRRVAEGTPLYQTSKAPLTLAVRFQSITIWRWSVIVDYSNWGRERKIVCRFSNSWITLKSHLPRLYNNNSHYLRYRVFSNCSPKIKKYSLSSWILNRIYLFNYLFNTLF